MIALLLIFHFIFNVPYYIIAPNGTLNSTWSTQNGLSGLNGFLSATNSQTSGLIGWATSLIPFVIILIALGYSIRDPLIAGLVASIVAAVISVIGTGIGTPPFVSNVQLYLFIALTIIFGIASFITNITRPYG